MEHLGLGVAKRRARATRTSDFLGCGKRASLKRGDQMLVTFNGGKKKWRKQMGHMSRDYKNHTGQEGEKRFGSFGGYSVGQGVDLSV